MSSPTPIITPRPKTTTSSASTTAASTPAMSIKPQGLESWRVMWKKYSTLAWGLVAALPSLYTQLLGLGPIPDRFAQILWGLAAFGLLCSWVKQRVAAAQ